MNLCTNAWHAMKEERGVLAVTLSVTEVTGEDRKAASLSLLPGKYVRLEVSDTGHGIERAKLERIFDPYFTTKGKGEGTGLGLAVVHGIVKSHSGHISVYSEPGEGTTFNVYIPRLEPDIVSGQGREAGKTVSSVETLPGGEERILVVDDEEQIVDAISQMLERLGYRVSSHTDSLEALRVFTKEKDRIDLVVTDMTMPSMTGRELAQKILAQRPDLPIILCTGFSETIESEKSKVAGIRGFLMKPIIRADLARAVREALDGKG